MKIIAGIKEKIRKLKIQYELDGKRLEEERRERSKKFIESSYAAGELKLLLHEGLLVIATVLNGRLYLGRIEKAFFQELLASNNFLKINIIIREIFL